MKKDKNLEFKKSSEKTSEKKKFNIVPYIIGFFTSAVIFSMSMFFFCVSVNVKDPLFCFLIAFTLLVFVFVSRLAKGCKDFAYETVYKKVGSKNRRKKYTKFNFPFFSYIIPFALFAIVIIGIFVSSPVFNATAYSEILKVSDSDFNTDLAESVGTDSIALMDTKSAEMLGDREIGALSDVVSQFDVSYDYIQIDYNGRPVKVSALEYAGFFKWLNNKDSGVKGYVTVDPVSMTASFNECAGMKYIPSAHFLENAFRHMWLEYPTLILGNLHFEIDESGKPYYIASVYDKTVGLFGGKTVTGCIVLDPVTGETVKYDLADIPNWIDVVFNGDLICEQYNWYGTLKNGYMNSLFAKKDCKQVTTYVADEDEDDAPVSDYGYVAKDGDIWIYTGVTSVNGDSSNIGFLLANERTGESRYYAVSGADEKSAMAAAEGEVQEKGYQASFPSLINISGHPTYIMVLKDSGGLVKLYAAVNVQQYNLVTTAQTQAECISAYKQMLGIADNEDENFEIVKKTVTVASVRYIDIDGNTYIYIIDTDDKIYKTKACEHEEMLLVEAGDTLSLVLADNTIKSYTVVTE